MRLFIAEKPSMGMEIAKVLSIKNNTPLKRSDGFINIGNDIVTWQFGHLLELKSAGDIDPKYQKWDFKTLPIVPQKWERDVKKDCKKQFEIIKQLLDVVDEVVHAGDPDREGELLIRETLIKLNNTKPVKRILLNALDEKSILYALDNLKDDNQFNNLYTSAEARTRADWLIGINLTRAYTIIGKESGLESSINIGRVMTPTFALVVQRENEIRSFKPSTHYSLEVDFKYQTSNIKAKLKQDVPSENKDKIENIIAEIKQNSFGVINDYNLEKKTEYPLLPYSLSDLQLIAGKKYGYDPQIVLDTAQSLYEKKLTTYPRSDCSYLPENQFYDAEKILNNLSKLNTNFQNLTNEADINIKSKAWNDKKITAHHAIIPTTKICEIDTLSDVERNIYILIATCYIAQFYKPYLYNKATIEITCNGYIFTATGKTVVDIGWKKLYLNDNNIEENILPKCSSNEKVEAIKETILESISQPPKRFTTATLLDAMKKIDRFVQNPKLKNILKDVSGIGTEATRAAIIEKLLDKNFIAKNKKNIVLTKYGETIYKVLPKFLKTPDITAVWENELSKIAEGTGDVQKFLNGQILLLNESLRFVRSIKIDVDSPKCPYCKNILRPIVSKKTKTKYWICKNFSTKEDSKCKKGIFSDYKGKPVLILCPKCKKGYMKKKMSKEGNVFWGCDNYPDCKNILSDKNGIPDSSNNKNTLNRKKRSK